MANQLVDTNILLRIILQDNKTLADEALAIVQSADEEGCELASLVLAEVVYVLYGNGYDRIRLSTAVIALIKWPQFKLDENLAVIEKALDLFASTKLDFADCYLIARALGTKTMLKTLDKAMQHTYEKLTSA